MSQELRELLARMGDPSLLIDGVVNLRGRTLVADAERAIVDLLARIEALEAASVAAVPFMRHDGLCAIIGGYGYCSCGMEAARALLTPAQGE